VIFFALYRRRRNLLTDGTLTLLPQRTKSLFQCSDRRDLGRPEQKHLPVERISPGQNPRSTTSGIRRLTKTSTNRNQIQHPRIPIRLVYLVVNVATGAGKSYLHHWASLYMYTAAREESRRWLRFLGGMIPCTVSYNTTWPF